MCVQQRIGTSDGGETVGVLPLEVQHDRSKRCRLIRALGRREQKSRRLVGSLERGRLAQVGLASAFLVG